MALCLEFLVRALSSNSMELRINRRNLICRTSSQPPQYQPRSLESNREDLWMMRDRCLIVKGLHLSKE